MSRFFSISNVNLYKLQEEGLIKVDFFFLEADLYKVVFLYDVNFDAFYDLEIYVCDDFYNITNEVVDDDLVEIALSHFKKKFMKINKINDFIDKGINSLISSNLHKRVCSVSEVNNINDVQIELLIDKETVLLRALGNTMIKPSNKFDFFNSNLIRIEQNFLDYKFKVKIIHEIGTYDHLKVLDNFKDVISKDKSFRLYNLLNKN